MLLNRCLFISFGLQVLMHVVCTTVAAAVCVWPFQEADNVPVQKTKYWTRLTTPVVKVQSYKNEGFARF